MPYTSEDARRREAQLKADRERGNTSQRKPTAQLPFGAPYGNSSSYTPATDSPSAPFIPSADVYSPPAQDSAPDVSGGGSFDGGGASGDY